MNIKSILKKMFFKQYLNYLIRKNSNSFDNSEFKNKLLEAEQQLCSDYNCHFDIIEQRNDIIPEISVITPTYNAAQFLNELRESLEQQVIMDKLQWIIVNDSSTDNTEKIFHEMAKKTKLKSFKFINLDRNLGTSNALNVAADNSDAPILAWVSADDAYCDQKKLSVDLNMIENGYDCVFSRYFVHGPDLKNYSQMDVLSKNNFNSEEDKNLNLFFAYKVLIGGNIFNGSSSVFKKSLFLKAGKFDTNLGIFDQDGDLWSKFLLLKAEIGLSQTKSFYREHKFQNSKRHYEMTIFTNLVRIRMLNFAFSIFLNEYVEYFENKIADNIINALSYPISTYFFMEKSKNLKKNSNVRYFMTYSQRIFGEENINSLIHLSDKFERTKSFNIFADNLRV